MAISSIHHPFILAFGILGNIVSFFVYLAQLPTFYRICKKKSTESFQSLPYLTALISSMLWFYYALLKKNAMPMITINSFGIVVETLYIAVYIAYATRKARSLTIKLFAVMILGLFSLILLVVQVIVKRDSLRVPVLGWICVVVSITVFAAPLTILAQVIRTRSVEYMTFNLSFVLTLSAIIWFAYGLLQEDICIALPNTVGFVLGLVQMLLYAFYRKRKRLVSIKDAKQPEHIKNVVILSSSGNSEVFPVDIKPNSYSINVDDKNNKNDKVDEKDNEGEQMHEQTEKDNQIIMKV